MNKPNTQKGQVIIINTLLFFALSTAIIFAVTSPVVSSFQITKSFTKSKQAFLLANSAANETIYKLNTNKNLVSSETITLAQGSAITTLSDSGEGKVVSIQADVDSYKKNQEVFLSVGEGVSFNYGLQVGAGGFEMSGTSEIIGNVYSNGSIVGSGGQRVTGSAVSANISNPTAVTSNTGAVNPPTQSNFGGNSDALPQDIAQSFTVSTTTSISSLRILIKKTGTPASNITVRITADNGGKPHKTNLTSGTINASTVTSSFNYITVAFDPLISLIPGNTYWLVFDTLNLSGSYYSLGANDSVFGGGVLKTSANGWSNSNGGIWTASSPATLDAYFDIYVGGSTGLIKAIDVGTAGVGDAWAHEVEDSVVAGEIYCQVGSGNNGGTKFCNMSRPVPVQQSWPVSDGNINDWKNEASGSGATTSVSVANGQTISMGPMKIEGDLEVTAGGTLNLTGTLYVTGDIKVLSNNSVIRVDSSLGSKGVVIITDGKVSASGGGEFQGSGAPRSYILLITTSTCPTGAGCSGDNAVEVGGNTGAVALNAQKGTIEFSGGSGAKQVTANKIVMGGSTSIIYESGLVNPNFSSGPSGSWKIDSWKEVE